jgi:hypothetical protein
MQALHPERDLLAMDLNACLSIVAGDDASVGGFAVVHMAAWCCTPASCLILCLWMISACTMIPTGIWKSGVLSFLRYG